MNKLHINISETTSKWKIISNNAHMSFYELTKKWQSIQIVTFEEKKKKIYWNLLKRKNKNDSLTPA